MEEQYHIGDILGIVRAKKGPDFVGAVSTELYKTTKGEELISAPQLSRAITALAGECPYLSDLHQYISSKSIRDLKRSRKRKIYSLVLVGVAVSAISLHSLFNRPKEPEQDTLQETVQKLVKEEKPVEGGYLRIKIGDKNGYLAISDALKKIDEIVYTYRYDESTREEADSIVELLKDGKIDEAKQKLKNLKEENKQ